MEVLRYIPSSLEKLLEELSLLKTCKQAENEVCLFQGVLEVLSLGSHVADIWITCLCLLGFSV